jgi:hypothetical protein
VGGEGLAIAGPGAARGGLVEASKVGGSQIECGCDSVLVDALLAAGTRDGHDIGSLREQPGQRQLAGGDPSLGRQGPDRVDDREVALSGVAALAAMQLYFIISPHIPGLDRLFQPGNNPTTEDDE